MKDLRNFIKECETKLPKEFVRVSKEVDPKYEISAIITKLDLMGKHPLVFFENVKGYNMPVVCNTDNSMTKLGLALEISPEDVEVYYDKIENECIRLNKYPIREVKKSNAPCKEVIKVGGDVNLYEFPFRKNPIIHDMGAWQTTGFNAMMQIPLNVWMNRKLKEVVPDVKSFRYGAHMCGFIQLEKKHAGQPKQAILAAFANDLYLKYVVCLDTDIDITKGSEILWALTTRVQADRDIIILPEIFGSDLDLSCKEEGVQTKVGIDATAKPFRKDYPPERKISEEIMNRINLNDYIPNIESYK